jgi:hypothetical protein
MEAGTIASIGVSSVWGILGAGMLFFLLIDGRARDIVFNNYTANLLIISLIVIIAVVGILLANNASLTEAFTAHQPPGCFTEAKRGSDGKIHVQPGDQSFENLSEYVSALSEQYSLGKLCIPPQVKEYKSPVEGVLGGLGVGTISPQGVAQETATRVVTPPDTDRPWDTTPIMDVYDYDRTNVYENERNSRHGAMSTAVINDMTNRYKMDWAQLPFNSEAKAAQEDAFVAGRLENVYKEPVSGVFFRNMMGDGLMPPDVTQREEDERRMLNSYKPPEVHKEKEEEEMTTIGKLVKKLFASDKNYSPVVEKTGNNNWAITELIPKGGKETWADADQGTSIDSAVRAGWVPPTPSMQIFDHGTSDPYFYKAGIADKDNGRFYRYQDFGKWSPQLSQMFAPSVPTRDWT